MNNRKKNLSMLVALFLIMMTASSVVSGDGTDLSTRLTAAPIGMVTVSPMQRNNPQERI